MGYSIQLKEAVLQKVLQGNRPQYEIATEYGIGRSTIGNWLRQYKRNGDITLKSKEKRPRDWTSEERVAALIATGSMPTEECAAWCRRNGLFPHHLEQWKKDAISGMSNSQNKQQVDKERNYINPTFKQHIRF